MNKTSLNGCSRCGVAEREHGKRLARMRARAAQAPRWVKPHADLCPGCDVCWPYFDLGDVEQIFGRRPMPEKLRAAMRGNKPGHKEDQ